MPTYYVVAPAECSSNLSRFDGVRYGHRCEDPADLFDLYTRTREEGFGDEVKRRIMTGTYVLSAGYYDAFYGQAQKVRTLVRRDFARAYEHVDVLVSPTSPTTGGEVPRAFAKPSVAPSVSRASSSSSRTRTTACLPRQRRPPTRTKTSYSRGSH